MVIQAPKPEQLLDIALDFDLELSEEDARSFAGLIAGSVPSYDRLDELAEPSLPVKYPRTSGWRPAPEENPSNAWYWRCEIKGANTGLLAGKRVGIKDNVCVAGVPYMNGCRVIEGYVPEVDATVVTRILDAGGTIVGKTACEDLCFSGGSHTSKPVPIKNPHRPTHSAGGSSGGSGAALVAGDCDMALGGDQGGSIRMPGSWCGVYGLKATHGLVPYTGIMPIELTIDHCGPMANTVEDVAKLLAAIAGPDGYDPRQIDIRVEDYLAGLGRGAAGLKLAVVKQGFGRLESEEATDGKVRDAIARLNDAGVSVTEVSIPMHLDGFHIWTAIIVEGSTELMIKGDGFGYSWNGHYVTSLRDAYARGWRSRPNDMSETVKMVLLLGEYMHRYYHGRYYAKAQNLRRALKAAYDAVLAEHDLLVMPTVPFRATAIPPRDCSREEYVTLAFNMLGNTCPFDVSGHPAMTVPCAKVDDLPVGMMLIGRRCDEATVLRAAAAFEALGDWRTF
jgi:amidase